MVGPGRMLGEEQLVVGLVRGKRARATLAALHVRDEPLGVDFLAIEKDSLVGMHRMRDDADMGLLDERVGKVRYAVRGHAYVVARFVTAHPQYAALDDVVILGGELDELSRQEPDAFPLQGLAAARLRQVAIEALLGIEALALAIGIGRQRDHLCVLAHAARLPAQHAQTCDTVHDRHEMVHEDEVVFAHEGFLQRLFAIRRRLDLHLRIAQELGRHHEVRGVVVDHEHARLRRDETPGIGPTRVACRADFQVDLADGPRIGNRYGKFDREGGATHVNAVDLDASAHEIDQLLHDGKPEARPLYHAVLLGFDALESREEVGKVVLLNPDAGVGNREDD